MASKKKKPKPKPGKSAARKTGRSAATKKRGAAGGVNMNHNEVQLV